MKIYCESHPKLAQRETLFLHGNLASHRWWHPTLEEWRQQGATGSKSLHFVDWRGSGDNPPWPAAQRFDLKDLAEDVLQQIDTLNLNDVDLIGHSLGGLIAIQMMCLEPSRFHKAVLLDPVGLEGVVFDQSMYEAFRQMAESESLTQSVILSTIKNSETLSPETAKQMGRDAYKAVCGIGTSVLEILKSVDLRESVEQLKLPILYLHGAHDQVIPVEDSKKAVTSFPNAQLEILTEAGHCWNVENPKAFTERLREFL